MKGLSKIPNLRMLRLAYSRLQTKKINCKQLALYSQWCRFDARLSEMWLDYFAKNLLQINPIEFNSELVCMPWPAAALALLEFLPAHVEIKNKGLARAVLEVYALYVQPAHYEIFYFEMAKMKTHWQQQEVTATLKPFEKWGYYSKDAPLNKFDLKNKTVTYKKSEYRSQILNELIKKNKTVTVDVYLKKLNQSVSRRIAQLDLQNHPKLRPSGQTRGRVYHVV